MSPDLEDRHAETLGIWAHISDILFEVNRCESLFNYAPNPAQDALFAACFLLATRLHEVTATYLWAVLTLLSGEELITTCSAALHIQDRIGNDERSRRKPDCGPRGLFLGVQGY